ncbi:Holliday junction resolvase RuvX [Patescibacteria group bacterium]|nr:Holliday junction resolvase RuvX [Patescibacteria group bacterium]MBU1721595.1 Holliday junction resolvase RuvX [Patescibacteria group bacterium]MBU1901821.1 Holliday junction resolvase RuvX [Patescibacteria group bacterium]
MNILAIDHGEKRIGLAWARVGLDLVLPYGKIEEYEEDKQIQALVSLIKKESINLLVIGLPVQVDGGGETDHSKKIRAFGEQMKKHIDIPVFFEDERFTSQQADAMGGDVSRDEKSAMVILQSYLDNM